VRWHVTGTGLDPSWAFALNYAHAKGLVFGRDLVFTYGPWSWLTLPQAAGESLGAALAFQFGLWGVYAGALAWMSFVKRLPLASLALFALAVCQGSEAFHRFGYAGPDMFLVFLVFLLLACSLLARRWWIFFLAALAGGVTALMIKFSSGPSALSACGLFAVALWLVDRRKALAAGTMFVAGVPALFALAWWSYHPSAETAVNFLRGSAALADSFGVAMSLPAGPEGVKLAGAVMALFAILTGLLWHTRQPAAVLALATSASWFLLFKHSFIREPGHRDILFAMGALLWGVTLLVTRIQRQERWRFGLVLAAYVWLMGLPPVIPNARLTGERLVALRQALRPRQLQRSLQEASASAVRADRLPADWLARIGAAPVTPFPWECSYAAANPITLRPLPVLQNYSVGTAWLDLWNARLFQERERRPEFILVDWDAIDGRHPLADAPATFEQMYRWYDFDRADGRRLLLRRRGEPRFSQAVPLGRREIALPGGVVELPRADHPVLVRFRFEMTTGGMIRKLAYKIPEVRMTAFTGSGRSRSFRVVPGVLDNALLISCLPFDLEAAQALFEGNSVSDPVRGVLISGPGLDAFRGRAAVELLELPGMKLTGTPAPDFRNLPRFGWTHTWQVESIDFQDAAWRREVIPVAARGGFVAVRGWAVDRDAGGCAKAVLIEIDGRPVPAVYGLRRPDVKALFPANTCETGGFEWGVPAAGLGDTPHTLTLKVVAASGAGYYEADRPVRFRVEK
jgi:hypothetical protein